MIQNVDSNSFEILGFPITYNGSTKLDDISALAQGLFVAVKGQLDGVGTTLQARVIRAADLAHGAFFFAARGLRFSAALQPDWLLGRRRGRARAGCVEARPWRGPGRACSLRRVSRQALSLGLA